ncbi:MAG: class I SAM-dependent methyltransferase [Desulfovibrionales bacterium]|nr:MAG: class I SAM-dependent methyltransferase [Desulfovibrionales bacterium]
MAADQSRGDHPISQGGLQADSCRICTGPVHPHFQAQILGRHQVSYFRCPECGLIQTEPPYWLAEAHGQAVSALDVGLVRRNLDFATRLEAFLTRYFHPGGRFLDYAGGYGLMVRLMRDAGYDFHRHDPYCANIFAQGFDVSELSGQRFELITAFELLEHLETPVSVVKQLLNHTESLMFSTRLQPEPVPTHVDDWWYFWPQTGQHVTFYTRPALQRLADQTRTTLYTDGRGLHLLTRQHYTANPLHRPKGLLAALDRLLERWQRSLRKRMVPAPGRPPSLLPEDVQRAERQLLAHNRGKGQAP